MKRILYDVPRWDIFMHRDARGLGPVEKDDPAQRQFEDELFERLYAGAAEALPDEDRSSELRSWAERVHEACDRLPAFARLAQECRGDVMAAAAAVETLVAKLAPQMNEQGSQESAGDHRLRGLMRGACEQAAKTVEELREAAEGLGQVAIGHLPGTASTPTSSEARNLLRRLKDDPRLKQIALLAGRFKRIAATKQRTKTRHGADEVTDIEQGADLGRLLPVELVKLVHPILRRSMQRDLIEKQCLQYQLRGSDTLGKGPLVVCLDKSGSMEGPADIWATASALALLDIAQRQRRPFGLLEFDTQVKYEALVTVGGALPEDGLFIGCSGGTRIDRTLERALAIIEEQRGPWRKADVVLITDGASDPLCAAELRAKAVALEVTILGLGIGVEPEVLSIWCDRVETITDVDQMDDKAAELLFTT